MCSSEASTDFLLIILSWWMALQSSMMVYQAEGQYGDHMSTLSKEWDSAVPFGPLLQNGASIKAVNRSGGATSEL